IRGRSALAGVVSHVRPDNGQVTGAGWVGGDVAYRPGTELAILVCLTAVGINGVIADAIVDQSGVHRRAEGLTGSRIDLYHAVVVAIRRVRDIAIQECHIDGAILGHYGDGGLVVEVCAGNLNGSRPGIPAVVSDRCVDRRADIIEVRIKFERG